MRYWSFDYPHEDGYDIVETWSEDDIRERYFPIWYEKMCKKFGEDYVRANASFEDCIEDWTCINWAWESKA